MSGKSYSINLNLVNQTEANIITSIIRYAEEGKKKVNVSQIAEENFVSTAFIYKMCKRLGFNGYSELYYYLSKSGENNNSNPFLINNLVNNYSEKQYQQFEKILSENRNKKSYAVGCGPEDIIAGYMGHRLSICGFNVQNSCQFYSYMLYRQDNGELVCNVDPSFVLAVSQSGNTPGMADEICKAKELGFSIILFTRSNNSIMSKISDVVFVIEPSSQDLIPPMPNYFFGKSVLAFDTLVANYINGSI